MLDTFVLRANLANKILPNQLLFCRFGQNQVDSLVAISQTLDKLVVFNLVEALNSSGQFETQNQPAELISYVKVNDVIRAISVRRQVDASSDLLLIGCANSICVFDTRLKQTLFQVNTSTAVHLFAQTADREADDELLPVCAGAQKLLALSLGVSSRSGEITSERSTSDTITCLIRGQFVAVGGEPVQLAISGSRENKIRVYQVDAFECNIQPSELTLDESSPITCLCAIKTQVDEEEEEEVEGGAEQSASGAFPALGAGAEKSNRRVEEQMDYFAFGCENGLVGVYRLLAAAGERRVCSGAERVWTCKLARRSAPTCMLMLDVNGDGRDELVIGFRGGRLEARWPFTGQLIAATRCLAPGERLAAAIAATTIGAERTLLLVCAANGSLVGLRPVQGGGRRKPLRGFGATNQLRRDGPPKAKPIDEDDDEAAAAAKRLAYLTLGDRRVQDDLAAPTETTAAAATSDLHIEMQSDNTKPTGCETRQSCELLQQLARMQGEQIELEKKACRLYNATMHQLTALSFGAGAEQLVVSVSWNLAPSASAGQVS